MTALELSTLDSTLKALNYNVRYLVFGDVEVECPKHPGNFILIPAMDLHGWHAPLAGIEKTIKEKCTAHIYERAHAMSRFPEGAEL